MHSSMLMLLFSASLVAQVPIAVQGEPRLPDGLHASGAGPQDAADEFERHVRPLLAQVREELGVPADPLAAYAASGYEARIAGERGITAHTGGYQ